MTPYVSLIVYVTLYISVIEYYRYKQCLQLHSCNYTNFDGTKNQPLHIMLATVAICEINCVDANDVSDNIKLRLLVYDTLYVRHYYFQLCCRIDIVRNVTFCLFATLTSSYDIHLSVLYL